MVSWKPAPVCPAALCPLAENENPPSHSILKHILLNKTFVLRRKFHPREPGIRNVLHDFHVQTEQICMNYKKAFSTPNPTTDYTQKWPCKYTGGIFLFFSATHKEEIKGKIHLWSCYKLFARLDLTSSLLLFATCWHWLRVKQIQRWKLSGHC